MSSAQQVHTCSSPGADTCCYDITSSGVTPVASPLSGVDSAETLPSQPSYVRDSGRGGWLYWTSEQNGKVEQRLWGPNTAACNENGGVLLDLPLLAAGADGTPSPKAASWASAEAEVAAILNSLPQGISSERLPGTAGSD